MTPALMTPALNSAALITPTLFALALFIPALFTLLLSLLVLLYVHLLLCAYSLHDSVFATVPLFRCIDVHTEVLLLFLLVAPVLLLIEN
jgi:hypothetical protein